MTSTVNMSTHKRGVTVTKGEDARLTSVEGD